MICEIFLLNRRTARPGCEDQASSQLSGSTFLCLRKVQGEEDSKENLERKARATCLRACAKGSGLLEDFKQTRTSWLEASHSDLEGQEKDLFLLLLSPLLEAGIT